MNYVDNPFKSPATLSFCPGILGIERGLTRAGVNCRVAAYVEIEAFIIANLVAAMESGLLDPAPIWTDANTFDARPFRGRIHGIIGGYPCTPFSLAGTRSGENHAGHIYPAISRACETTRPVWAFFENVDDHLSLGFDSVYKDLQRMGYAVETGIYTAEEVGAPHERERMFILAVANSNRYGYGTRAGQSIGEGCQAQGKEQREEWNELLGEWMRDVIRNSGKELVNSPGIGERKPADETDALTSRGKARYEFVDGSESVGNACSERLEIGQEQSAWKEQSATERTNFTRWPAGQGHAQYDWEEPRTIESSMGCTINGYNFREDFLRALGNSVVEQTAELAFIDLLKKHLHAHSHL